MLKAYTTRIGRECASLGREIQGGNGIITDYGVAKHFCDMESTYTYEGTYDINSLIAGRMITGLNAISPPQGAASKI